VLEEVGRQLAQGSPHILGVMFESNIVAGRQDVQLKVPRPDLVYGQSVTDACVDLKTTEEMLELLAASRRAGRLLERVAV